MWSVGSTLYSQHFTFAPSLSIDINAFTNKKQVKKRGTGHWLYYTVTRNP